MVTGIVVIRVAVPPALPRIAGPILFGVVDTEVIRFEPAYPQRGTFDPTSEIAEVVVRDDGVRCEGWSRLDILETSAPGEMGGDPVQKL